jgi:cytochrome c556
MMMPHHIEVDSMILRPSFRSRVSILSMFGIALLCAELPAPAAPALSPQAAIEARRASFKKMGAAMKSLNGQFKSGSPSKAEVAKGAQAIALASRDQPKLFPAGSGASAGVPTDALPEIWKDRKTFDAQMLKLIQESNKLVAVSKGADLAAMEAQVKATGAVCGACHRQFRADN